MCCDGGSIRTIEKRNGGEVVWWKANAVQERMVTKWKVAKWKVEI